MKMNLRTDIKLLMISCPGVRLKTSTTEMYLRIKLFDCLAISSKVTPRFPLIFYEHFCFGKRFRDCYTITELFELLSGETVVIELMNENNLIISKYESNAKEFLYPTTQLRPKYSQSSRSLLLECCLLPIAPKLEFQTINTITTEEESEESECNTELESSE